MDRASLDRGTGGEGVRFYVYNLQNSARRALGAAAAAGVHRPRDAAGRRAGADARAGHARGHDRVAAHVPGAGRRRRSRRRRGRRPAAPPRRAPPVPGAPGPAQGIVRNIQVVADKDNNTLLIVATPAEYTVIEAALKKLDIAARQVLIEMVIAEVSLIDDFQFGVEWYFKNGPNQAGGNFRRGTVPGDIFGAITGTAAAPSPARASARASPASATCCPACSPAASRRRCRCWARPATPRSSPTRTSRRSTTRSRRSRSATGSRSAQQTLVGGTDQRGDDDVAVHRHRRAAWR